MCATPTYRSEIKQPAALSSRHNPLHWLQQITIFIVFGFSGSYHRMVRPTSKYCPSLGGEMMREGNPIWYSLLFYNCSHREPTISRYPLPKNPPKHSRPCYTTLLSSIRWGPNVCKDLTPIDISVFDVSQDLQEWRRNIGCGVNTICYAAERIWDRLYKTIFSTMVNRVYEHRLTDYKEAFVNEAQSKGLINYKN